MLDNNESFPEIEFPFDFPDDNLDTPVKPETDEKPEPEIQDDNIVEDSETADPILFHLNMLKESGLLLLPEDYKLTIDSAEEALALNEQYRTQLAYQDLMERLPQNIRSIVDYGLSGGSEVDKFLEYQNNIDVLDVDITDEKNQAEIVRQYLKSRGNDDYVIQAAIERLQDTDRLSEEASKRQKEMKTAFQQAQQEMIQQERLKAQAQYEAQVNYQKQITDYIGGQRWTEKSKREMYNYLFSPENNASLTLNQIVYNPEHYVQLARFLKENYDPKTGFKTQKSQEVDAARSVKNRLQQALQQSIPSGRMSQAVGGKKQINPEEFDIPFYYD